MGTAGIRPGWRVRLGADAALALALALLVAGLHLSTDAIASLERRLFDAASTWATPTPSDRIVIVAVDDASIARLGRWPWSRDVHAQLIDRIAEARPRAIVHTTLFLEPQADRGLAYIRRLHEAATQAVKHWQCNPATRDGHPVPAVALQPFNFVLDRS